MIIAIDGFSSCGKSTLAKALAKHYNYIFIDTGAMYRAVTHYFITHSIDLSNPSEIASALSMIKIELIPIKGDLHTFLNGENVSNVIRGNAVAGLVSDVAKIPLVREKMVAYQREMAKESSVVMDGRDIGTVVFPDANVKLFVTADTDERVRRRFKELQSKNIESSEEEEVKKNLQMRDYIDSTRAHSPLRKAEDAFLLDNTFLSPEEQLGLAIKIVESKLV